MAPVALASTAATDESLIMEQQMQMQNACPIQYITDNLLVTALPQRARKSTTTAAPAATAPGSVSSAGVDDSIYKYRNYEPQQQQKNKSAATAAAAKDNIDEEEDVYFTQRLDHLAMFLQDQQTAYGDSTNSQQFILVSVAADPPDPALHQVFGGQVVTVPWQAAGAPASELPTMDCLLQISYVLQAALHWTSSSTGDGSSSSSSSSNNNRIRVVLACENGQTRSGLAIAAYLRYVGAVPCTRDGFLHFCVRTVLRQSAPSVVPDSSNHNTMNYNNNTVNPMQVYEGLPPSVKGLLQNWDQLMEWQTWLNPHPMLLRAITVQGIPVEDQPCLDVYDGTGKHVYSSHAWLHDDDGDDDVEEMDSYLDGSHKLNTEDEDESPSLAASQSNISALTGGSVPVRQQEQRKRRKAALAASPWVDDEGFYKVNEWVAGDFCVLCRFGGLHAVPEQTGKYDNDNAEMDDSTKLLFRFAHATTVLPAGPLECPMSHVDIMQRYQPFLDPQDFLLTLVFEAPWEKTTTITPDEYLGWTPPPLVFGPAALEQGCLLLTQFHALQPTLDDLEEQQQFVPGLHDCPPNILTLLWQLSSGNGELIASRWQGLVQRYQAEEALQAKALGTSNSRAAKASHLPDSKQIQSILDILDEEDEIEDNYDRLLAGAHTAVVEKKSSIAKDEDSNEVTEQSGSGLPTTITSSGPHHEQQQNHHHHNHNHHNHHHKRGPHHLQWRSTILRAHAGDISVALGLRGHAYDWVHTVQQAEGLPIPTDHPRLPMLPLRQSERLPPLEPLDDPANAAAVELFLQLQHVGVTLEDLQDLAAAKLDNMPESPPTKQSASQEDTSAALGNPNEACYHEEEKKADGKEDESMTKDVEKPVEDKPNDVDAGEATAKTEGSNEELSEKEEPSKEEPGGDSSDIAEKPPMKKDTRFQKYWKMKSVGLPEDAIKHAMQRDNVDVSVLALDWEKNYEEQTSNGDAGGAAVAGDSSVPMKKDSRFEKYWKMKSVGLPDGAIRNAIVRDRLVDVSILELDWDKTYEEQTAASAAQAQAQSTSGPPMKEDPRFEKYWKMKSVGLPGGAILNAMARDNVDGSVLNLDWDKTYEEQTASAPSADAATATAPSGPPMKEDPRFAKYWKMKCVGLPDGAIENAMARDNVDTAALGLDWEKNFEAQTAGSSDGPPMKEDPKFTKYWKMKSVGLPDGAIRNAMAKDGLDPSLFDLDWEKSLAAQQGVKDSGPALKDDPEFTKYFQMMSMGLPPGAVKNAMSRDGKDPSIIDLDPNCSLASQYKIPAKKHGSIVPAKRVRRKKIFWKPLAPEQIKEDSLWSLVKKEGQVSMRHLNYDVKEFEDLFTESAEPGDKKKKIKPKAAAAAAKKTVQVIDGKRDMNGGIILSRLRLDYGKIAEMVEKMDQGRLDANQLMGLKEYLPTPDERKGLDAYMLRCGKSEEDKAKGYADLSECEKYMWKIKQVDDAARKFDCMLFRAQFRTRVDELVASIKVVENACDEVKNSESLRKVLAMILTLVNTINTGGEGKGSAQGFNLDGLLKLNEAKAFDKKTSVLQYLVKLVRVNDETLLNFHKELKHVREAENVLMDLLSGDIKKLAEDLAAIREPVAKAAEIAEANGERTFKLNELKEQRTTIRKNGTVLLFNKVDHLTGRTPMERFFLRACNEVGGLMELSESVKSKYENLLEFFGEDSQMPSNEFFGTMNKFMKEFMVSEKQVEKEEKAREKQRRKDESKAKTAAKKASVNGTIQENSGHQNSIQNGAGRKGEIADDSQHSASESPPKQQASKTSEKSLPTAHPLAAMLEARHGDALETETKKEPSSNAHPVAAMLAARQADAHEAEAETNKEPSCNAHPLAAMLAARQADAPVTETNTEPSSNAHPLAAMLEARQSDTLEAEKEPTSNAHPLATMLAARQTDTPEAETEVETEPSSSAHQLATMLEARQNDTPEADHETSSAPSSNAHPLAAIIAEHQSDGPESESKRKSENQSEPAPTTDLQESREQEKQEAKKEASFCPDPPEAAAPESIDATTEQKEEDATNPSTMSTAHPLAAMLAARQQSADPTPNHNPTTPAEAPVAPVANKASPASSGNSWLSAVMVATGRNKMSTLAADAQPVPPESKDKTASPSPLSWLGMFSSSRQDNNNNNNNNAGDLRSQASSDDGVSVGVKGSRDEGNSRHE